MITGTGISGGLEVLYVNGVAVNSTTLGTAATPSAAPISIGGFPSSNCFDCFMGQIADVQIYNTALSSSQIQQLYQEGIGGTPISNAGLAGWWPLNGNANDYSGNNNVGIPSNVIYYNSGYMPQSLVNSYQISKSGMPLGLVVNGTSRQYNVSVVVWR